MNGSDVKKRVLVIDDDPKMSAFVAGRLRAQNYRTEIALDGKEGLEVAAKLIPNLVLLDLSMPVLDGIETLSRLREWYQGPIIILSATHENAKKVEALDKGADDYLTKPFSLDELLARVRSALRRLDRLEMPSAGSGPGVVVGDVEIDMAMRVVKRNGSEISLTRTEYELLRLLASNLGKVMTHRELLQTVWGPEYGEESEYLRTFIKQLRKKLEKNPSRPSHVLTQPGIGYRLVG